MLHAIAAKLAAALLIAAHFIGGPQFGLTLTNISSSTKVSDYPSIQNANNAAIIAGTIAVGTTSVGSITSLPNLTSAASLATVGTITSGALGSGFTTIAVGQGGTGTTTNRYKGIFFGDGSVFRQASSTGLLDFDTATRIFTAANASTTYLSGTNIMASGLVGAASTSPNFPLSIGTVGSNFYVTNAGKVVGLDSTNSFEGRLSPTHSFALGTGTTTTWTASTTGTALSPFALMPFSGSLRQVYCKTDTSFLGVNIQVNGSDISPSYFVASTTAGIIKFTAGNTFTRGQTVAMNVGTTTTASTLKITCTFDLTETP